MSPAHHGRGWIAVGALACGMHAALACDPTTLRKRRRFCRALYRQGGRFNLGSAFSFSNWGQKKDASESGVHGRWQDGRRRSESTPRGPRGEPPVPSYRDVPGRQRAKAVFGRLRAVKELRWDL